MTNASIGRTRFFRPEDWSSFALTTVLAFAVYVWTLAPEVTLEESGTYSAGAMYAGVPKPPGYPLWVLCGWLFVRLVPFGSVAWRLELFNAIVAAVTCGLLALMVSRGAAALLDGGGVISKLNVREAGRLRAVCGGVAGLAFGFNNAFWNRVVVVEVWPLSIFLLTATLCLLMRWAREPERRRWLYAASFVYGLAVTNSQALLPALPAFPLFVAMHDRKLGRDLFVFGCILFGFECVAKIPGCFPLLDSYGSQNRPMFVVQIVTAFYAALAAAVLVIMTRGCLSEGRVVLQCTAWLSLGLALYPCLPVLSMMGPPMNWGYPRTVEGFWHVLSRGQFDSIHPTNHWIEYTKQVWMYWQVTLKSFGLVQLSFAVVPFCFLHRMPPPERRWLLGLSGIFVCLALVMLVLLAPGTDRSGMDFAETFFTASYVVMAVWMGMGMVIVGAAVSKGEREHLVPNPSTSV